jgi:hypothetical protein
MDFHWEKGTSGNFNQVLWGATSLGERLTKLLWGERDLEFFEFL